MSFEDLPDDWPQIPIGDPQHTADLLDLVVSMKSRFEGTVLILVCDPEHRPIQPIEIGGVGEPPEGDSLAALEIFASGVADHFPGGAVLLALARQGGLSITNRDRQWRACLEGAFKDRLTVLGTHLVTPAGSRLVHAVGRAA